MAYGGLDPDLAELLQRITLGSSAGIDASVRFTKRELRRLYGKAVIYDSVHGQYMRTCNFFYRDKTPQYFNDIIMNKDYLMEVYKKDFHGDPKSPTNGRINGLFFSVNIDKRTGKPPIVSIYGPRRLLIPSHRILHLCPNAYFTDFYCVRKTSHYVTLVFTKPGTSADKFCIDNLIPFDMENNPFLCKTRSSLFGTDQLEVTDGVWVEVLITEHIDIETELLLGAEWSDTLMKGRRSGGNRGLRKDSLCSDCNL